MYNVIFIKTSCAYVWLCERFELTRIDWYVHVLSSNLINCIMPSISIVKCLLELANIHIGSIIWADSRATPEDPSHQAMRKRELLRPAKKTRCWLHRAEPRSSWRAPAMPNDELLLGQESLSRQGFLRWDVLPPDRCTDSWVQTRVLWIWAPWTTPGSKIIKA
jgi:hypothetical protein